MALLFPILLMVIYVALQASYAYVIAQNMNEGAYLAARALAVGYRFNPNLPNDTTSQQTIFSRVRITNFVASNSQFSIPSNGWNMSTPATVTVKCRYLSGQGSPALPTFPKPDLLGLGSAFVIESNATYRLQQ
jgi:hypothetical protein